jgi:hypothetical protein
MQLLTGHQVSQSARPPTSCAVSMLSGKPVAALRSLTACQPAEQLTG